MNKNKIAFIVEGSRTEPQIVKSLNKYIFANLNIEIISLSYTFNIYQLWLALKEYDFDADLIDIINEKNSNDKVYQRTFGPLKSENYKEVYLFFDYDGHQDNLPKTVNGDEVIKEMLMTFDNETELGKLIISYPMVEAIRDYSDEYGICFRCVTDGYINQKYKKQTGAFTRFHNLAKINENDWNDLIQIFLNRCKCLLQFSHISKYVENEISPRIIFENQHNKFLIPYEKVMVLSAFVEFLVEYYGRYLFNEDKELDFLKLIK